MIRNLYLLPISLAVICAAALYFSAYAYFKAQALDQAEARLTLYRSTVEAELRRFAHLPFVLSLDPLVVEALETGATAALNKRLARFAQSAGVDAIYLMDLDGTTISASNAQTPGSFLGQNYAFRPYFQAAMRGEHGEFYGVGATTGIPGYFYAMPVRSGPSGIRGVVAIKIDLTDLQDSWQASGERILLSNADGVVLLASNPRWRYRALRPLGEAQRQEILTARQFGPEALTPLDWAPNMALQTASLVGDRLLYLRTDDLPNSWSLHFFLPDDQVVTRSALSTGLLLFLMGLLFIVVQVRRLRRVGEALKRSEREEAQLRRANERLADEIEERRAAERRLQKTQAELERAGRLAALGQLASSVTHELGQPIAAMKNQLAAAEMTAGPTRLNDKMQGLVARMEDITRQLKFFSRKGRDKFESVDIRDVVAAALELLAPTIHHCEATLHVARPDQSCPVRGNRLRLEQVVTNLVRNALDAVDGGEVRQVDVAIGQDEEHVWLEVSDTGHGLGDRSLEDLREPFTTTRESGKGMGLGLTISSGIVSDHDGTITAANKQTGGAVFRVDLPLDKEAAPA